MEVQYRQLFLKDLKKLKRYPVYEQIFRLVFSTLSEAETLQEVSNVKAMKNYPDKYRIRIGDYRVGFVVDGNRVEMMRAMHRKEFCRYFL